MLRNLARCGDVLETRQSLDWGQAFGMSEIFPQPKSVAVELGGALGHYVYLLINPRDGKFLYVGKVISGCGLTP